MLKNLRIPTLQIRCEIIVVNRKCATYKVFLPQTGADQEPQRPSEMLNGARTFLPVVDAAGRIVFLPMDAIIMLSMPGSQEFRPDSPPSAETQLITAEVAVDLSDATQVYGGIEFVEDGRTRIQDYLNRADRFLILRQDDSVVFVNKRHVTRIAPVDGS